MNINKENILINNNRKENASIIVTEYSVAKCHHTDC
jgi:hypothetical protein